MTLSISKPFVSIFKKGKSKKNNDNNNEIDPKQSNYLNNSNSNNLVNSQQNNEKLEEIYTVLYQIYDNNSCRGASPQAKYEERTIKINEEGVFLYDQNKLVIQWGFQLIKEFSLDENWSDWIVVLRDNSKHYFKSYESIQIHLKINDIIRKLVSQVPAAVKQ